MSEEPTIIQAYNDAVKSLIDKVREVGELRLQVELLRSENERLKGLNNLYIIPIQWSYEDGQSIIVSANSIDDARTKLQKILKEKDQSSQAADKYYRMIINISDEEVCLGNLLEFDHVVISI